MGNKRKFIGIIRSIKESDLKAIENLFSDWMINEETGAVSKKEVEHYLRYIKNSLNDQVLDDFNAGYLVAETSKREIVGIIAFRKPIKKILPFTTTPNPAELNHVFVAKEHRGEGIGSALIKKMLEVVKQRGYTEIIVRSGPMYKETGWGFYDKLSGFERISVLDETASGGKVSQLWRYLP